MADVQQFFEENPDVETLEAFIVDVSGILRGKKMPRANAGKLFKGGVRMPRSAFAVDIWGQDVPAAQLIIETGDNDGVCYPVKNSLRMVPWLKNTAQVMLTMKEPDGRPFFGDSRQVLKKIVGLYAKKGWTPVVAAELEFYLLDALMDERGNPQPPLSPRSGKRSNAAHLFSISEITEFDNVLGGISKACDMQGIPADACISENGPGQYEINLFHVPDALAAADHATLMKRVVRGVARKHGFDATFMAKPYGNEAGNGMHVHFSVLDKKGKNIFAGKDYKGSPALRHALGGLLKHMGDTTAIFAPNFNSYRRFAVGSHAPTAVAWGYDNRTAACRVPAADIDATRIEHRVAGGDTNPYLCIAAILAAAYDGLVNKLDPGKPASGNIYNSKAKRLPNAWETALELFEGSKFIKKYFGENYQRMYLACKLQEQDIIDRQVSSLEYDTYLRDI
jgi:glutamine synthetase